MDQSTKWIGDDATKHDEHEMQDTEMGVELKCNLSITLMRPPTVKG